MQPELEPSPVLSGKLNHEGPTPYMFQDRMHKVLYDISLTPWIHEGFFLIHFALELSFSIQFFFRHKAGIVTLRHLKGVVVVLSVRVGGWGGVVGVRVGCVEQDK